MRYRGLRDPMKRIEVGFHRAIKVERSELTNRFSRLLSAGIDHENIEASEMRRGIGDELPTPGFVGDIAGQADRNSSLRFDQVEHLDGIRFLLWQIGDRNVNAFPREGDRRGAAYAAIAASDKCFATYELTRTLVACLAMVRGVIFEAGPGAVCGCLGKGGRVYCLRRSCLARRLDMRLFQISVLRDG
jgi:hypothetical protein